MRTIIFCSALLGTALAACSENVPTLPLLGDDVWMGENIVVTQTSERVNFRVGCWDTSVRAPLRIGSDSTFTYSVTIANFYGSYRATLKGTFTGNTLNIRVTPTTTGVGFEWTVQATRGSDPGHVQPTCP